MAKEFQITETQKQYLKDASEKSLYASQYDHQASALNAMVKRGWLYCVDGEYRISLIGTALLRQLGMIEPATLSPVVATALHNANTLAHALMPTQVTVEPQTDLERLQRENEILRKALDEIQAGAVQDETADAWFWLVAKDSTAMHYHLATIARKALKEADSLKED